MRIAPTAPLAAHHEIITEQRGDHQAAVIARLNGPLFASDWEAQETPVLRNDGRTNGYGLGVYTRFARQRHIIDHGGEAVGFLTQNTVYPDTKDAIVVFTNADFSGASDSLTPSNNRGAPNL